MYYDSKDQWRNDALKQTGYKIRNVPEFENETNKEYLAVFDEEGFQIGFWSDFHNTGIIK